jgi:hypothetical protein
MLRATLILEHGVIPESVAAGLMLMPTRAMLCTKAAEFALRKKGERLIHLDSRPMTACRC